MALFHFLFHLRVSDPESFIRKEVPSAYKFGGLMFRGRQHRLSIIPPIASQHGREAEREIAIFRRDQAGGVASLPNRNSVVLPMMMRTYSCENLFPKAVLARSNYLLLGPTS